MKPALSIYTVAATSGCWVHFTREPHTNRPRWATDVSRISGMMTLR